MTESGMNITFVTIHVEQSERAVPLAAGMLAANVRRMLEDSVRISFADFVSDDETERCIAEILAQQPDLVGFSVYVWNRSLCSEIALALRARRPELVLFAGGPEVSADPEGFCAEGVFDFVVPGEGEALLPDALLLVRDGAPMETVRKVTAVPSVPDLSSLPSPWLEGTLDPRNYPGVLWELSRGCPFSCHFCFESRGTHGIRTFPVQRIREELELFARSGVQEIFVLDPTFNHDRKRAAQMLTIMRETAPHIRYYLEIRSEFLDRKTAQLFAAIPCSLQIGLQSMHPSVLKNVGRSIDPEDFSRKVLLLHEAGVTYGFDLIYGLPGDTLSGFLESLDRALEMAPNHIDIFPLEVLPGTRLAQTASGFALEHERAVPYRVLRSPTWSAEELRTAEGVTEAFDLFYNQGRAVPWFRLVLSNLGMEPSGFFVNLARRLSGSDPGEEELRGMDPVQLQRSYLARLFEECGSPDSALIAQDIVTLFAFENSYPPETTASPVFTFDPELLMEHLEAGAEDFAELAFFVPRTDS